MTHIKHTPTPWHIDKNRGDCGGGRYLYSVLTNEEGRVIIDCFNSDVSTVYEEHDGDDWYRWDAQGEADISYALEAVNNHERLIQRVQELEEVLVLAEHKIDQYLQGQYPEGNSLGRILKAIRVTLAGKKESDE
jgi:hypothetical protein